MIDLYMHLGLAVFFGGAFAGVHLHDLARRVRAHRRARTRALARIGSFGEVRS